MSLKISITPSEEESIIRALLFTNFFSVFDERDVSKRVANSVLSGTLFSFKFKISVLNWRDLKHCLYVSDLNKINGKHLIL